MNSVQTGIAALLLLVTGPACLPEDPTPDTSTEDVPTDPAPTSETTDPTTSTGAESTEAGSTDETTSDDTTGGPLCGAGAASDCTRLAALFDDFCEAVGGLADMAGLSAERRGIAVLTCTGGRPLCDVCDYLAASCELEGGACGGLEENCLCLGLAFDYGG